MAPEVFKGMMAKQSDLDTMRAWYCHQIGIAFLNVHLMEDAIINAMNMCDRVKVSTKVGNDIGEWDRIRKKVTTLQATTLGNLINILEKHEILDNDVRYLRWVKDKRDLFVHRLFRDNPWPGEVGVDNCEIFIRRMAYLQIIFSRASHRIWRILERADLIIIDDLGGGGLIAMNYGVFDHLDLADQDSENDKNV
ncbi:hypothetical protein [Azospirillum argentinense]